jgi:hypothetical protein
MDHKIQKLFKNVGIFAALAMSGTYDRAVEYKEEVRGIKAPQDLIQVEPHTGFSLVGIVRSTGELWKINGSSSCLITVPWAFGSGTDWAIAAMDHGKTAVQAVKYAATRDLFTNNRVQSYTHIGPK